MNQPRVLIVDDDPALLQALPEALRLRMREVTVDTADSAAAALDRIAARDYDAIVTDIKMPGMDGLTLLAEIRGRRPDTPILMITGHGEDALAIQALRGGAYDFIPKPIDRDHIVASLHRAIRARALDRRAKDRQSALEHCAGELEQIAAKLGRDQARVLIVDDDPALLQALPQTLRLRMGGVTVETADSAAEALDRLAARDYDAVVTDIKMPGMDGLALLAEIRTRRPDTPTLIITGHGEHELVVRALRGGACDFIQKPIDRDHFVAALYRAIRAHVLNRRVKERKLALKRCTSELEQIVEKLGRGSEQARVLIVDDDPALLQALPRALQIRMAEVTVETADSAAAALDRIAAGDYDAIVTDIKMPGMDGLALLAEIRRRQPDTPILIITGHGEYDLSVRALRGGAYDFIPKPIDRDHFVAVLYRAIRAHTVNRRGRDRQLALERCTSELEGIVEKLGRELRGTP